MSTAPVIAPAQTSSQGPVTVAVAAVLLGFNVFFIGLRCYSSVLAKRFDYNDVLMIFAVLIYAGLLGLLIEAVQNGIGNHTSTATATGVGNSLKVCTSTTDNSRSSLINCDIVYLLPRDHIRYSHEHHESQSCHHSPSMG